MGWANVTSYGAPGSLVTARINGSASDHTAVFWNAMPLSNPALGLTDLSLIPMALFDAASIRGNQNLIGRGQGGLGGTISLDNSQHSESSLEFNTGLNSMRNAFLQSAANYRIFGVQMRTVVLKESNRNEFEYIDDFQIRSPRMFQHHNNSSNTALMQSADWKSDKGFYVKAQMWYQVRSSSIPELMGSNGVGTAAQRDSLLKGSFTAGYRIPSQNYFLSSSPIELNLGYNREFLRFTDRAFAGADFLSIDSRLRTDMSMQNIIWKPRTANGMHRFHVDVRNFNVGVKNSNYSGGEHIEPFQSVHFSYAFYLEECFSKISFFGYQERRKQLATKPSYGGEYYFQGNDIRFFIPNIRIAFAHRFRVPDFNERFWVPSGNPNLRPEQGNHGSLEMNWSLLKEKNIEWNILLDGGIQRVIDWVQWVPILTWTPINYKEVDIQYTGVMSEFFYKVDKHQLGLRAHWKWTSASGRNAGQKESFQMIYTPEHTLFGQLEYQYQWLEMGIDARYIDVRFTNEANSGRLALDAYYLLNGYIGFN
jgi:iron complex outermembrane receptor protein